MSELLEYKRETERLESDTIYCANHDELAVEYGLCEHCVSTLTECPICKETSLDEGVICHECGSVFIYVCEEFYATIDYEEPKDLPFRTKYYEFVNIKNDEILNVSFENLFDVNFSFNEDFLEGIKIKEFYEAIGLCFEDYKLTN